MKKIMLFENNKTISEEIKVLNIFRSYFDGIVKVLNVKCCEISKEHYDPIVNTIKTFENHASILKIKQFNASCKFSSESKF